MQDLVRQLNELSDEQPFWSGWYVKNLLTGETAERNGDVPTPSASTRKISILMAALKAVNEGRLRLDQPVTIDSKYQDNDSGVFQHLTAGDVIAFRDALVLMIIVSDNTCTGTVVDMVGLAEVQALCDSIGMKGTLHRFGIPPRLAADHPLEAVTTTTANDQGLLLELMLDGARDASAAAKFGCTTELCQLGLDILSWQKMKTRLPSLLPGKTKVAHKTGTGARGFMDAGIVFKDDWPLYILTAYTDQVPEETPDGTPGFAAASQLIGRLARTCWDEIGARAAAPVGAGSR